MLLFKGSFRRPCSFKELQPPSLCYTQNLGLHFQTFLESRVLEMKKLTPGCQGLGSEVDGVVNLARKGPQEEPPLGKLNISDVSHDNINIRLWWSTIGFVFGGQWNEGLWDLCSFPWSVCVLIIISKHGARVIAQQVCFYAAGWPEFNLWHPI